MIFQDIPDKQQLASEAIVQDFVKVAESGGFSVDDMIQMLASGMSKDELLRKVLGEPPDSATQD